MYAIRSYYAALKAHALLEINLKKIAENYQFLKKQLASGCDCAAVVVITSYSIHYTKLYEAGVSLFCITKVPAIAAFLNINKEQINKITSSNVFFIITSA